jgi:hypothetical protein
MTIAAVVALIGAVLVHQREVTLLTVLTEGSAAFDWSDSSRGRARARLNYLHFA